MTFVTHLECTGTGKHYKAGRPHNLSEAGKPLFVRYDLEGVKNALSKDELAARTNGLWRYREFLPVTNPENEVSLGEVISPLFRLRKSEKKLGVTGEVLIKDESRQPSGSFKARGLGMAVSMAKEFGLTHLAMPTNGNAGSALAAYATRAGICSTVLCPDDTPECHINETIYQGADVYLVNGYINHCGRIVAEGREKTGWFDVSTMKEPYRVEGKKTLGIEVLEQLGWEMPDAIFFPTGGGTMPIGVWKAFDELEKIGWIGPERPKMIVVQAAGCAPIVEAWERNEAHARVWEEAHTAAAGIRVPAAVGDFLILNAVRKSNGFAAAVDEDVIFDVWRDIGREEGYMLCPEGAATFAAYRQALQEGRIDKTERVVLFSCASGLKYPSTSAVKNIDRHQPVDFSRFK
ncbi:threonine synthase [Hyphococcus sp.]|uniref:threonine synthase n=1 Tax=Hyphococcus sp. TaxID=2038636 RepID=UPI003CCBD8E4